MEIDYAYLEKFLRFKLKGYRGNMEYEDAIQEGLVRAWKDAQDGTRTMEHIRNRAYSWAWNFLSSDHCRYHTGGIHKSREGIAQVKGEATREKVSGYREEYLRLHDRYPTTLEVAQALGMTRSRVQAAVAHLKKNYVKPVYKKVGGQTRIDLDYYKNSPLYHTDYTSGEEVIDVHAEVKSAHSWEQDFISNSNFQAMISGLSTESKQILVLTYQYGYTQADISKFLKVSQTTVGKRIKRAINDIRATLENGSSESVKICKNGHARTEDNIYIWKVSGRTKRACKKCVRARQQERRDRKKLEG